MLLVKIHPSSPPSAEPLPNATEVSDGVMSKEDKAKLNLIPAGGLAAIPARAVLYNPGPGPHPPVGVDMISLLTSQNIGQTVDYIYDPSVAATAPPVYKTIGELKAAVTAGPPNARVWFDASVTISSSWALPQNTWFLSRATAPVVTVTTSPGVILDNLDGIGYGLILKPLNSAPCLTWSALPANEPISFSVFFGALIDRSGSSAELAQIPDNRFGVYRVFLSPSGAASPPGLGSSVFQGMGTGTTLIGAQTVCGANGGIRPGDFVGLGTLVLQTGIDGTVLLASAFPGFSGTFTQVYTADARNFGAQAAGTVLGVMPGAPAGTLSNFRSLGSMITALAGVTVSGPPTPGAGGTINLAYVTTPAGHKLLAITDSLGDQIQLGSCVESGTCISRKMSGSFSLANNATADLDLDVQGGQLTVTNVGLSSSTTALFAVSQTSVTSLCGNTWTGFSATQDNAATINVYGVAGPKVRFQNKTGSTVILLVDANLLIHV